MPKGNPGQPKSPEHVRKIAAALRDKPKTAEHRKAISQSRIGSYGSGLWTPEKSRSAARRAAKRGDLTPASACSIDADHPGPYGYHHNGDPPYSFENRFVVLPLCHPCHQAAEAERRAGSGYANRRGRMIGCVVCGQEFYVNPSRIETARYCSTNCRYLS